MNLYEKYADLKDQKKELQTKIIACEDELWGMHKDTLKCAGIGSSKFFMDGLRLKVVQKENVSVDQSGARRISGPLAGVFKVKYSLDQSEYDMLGEADKNIIDELITVKNAKPSFAVEEKEEEE